MNKECLEKNAKRLFEILSYIPKEPKEMASYIDEDNAKKSIWNYEFCSKDLKSASKLVWWCNKHSIMFKYTISGIMVYNVSNSQINEARKLCNKPAKKFSIKI